MKNLKPFIFLTVVLNFFIVIAIGHGFGFLGIIEIFWLNDFFHGEVNFSLSGSNDDRLFTAAIMAEMGQIILVIAYFVRTQIQKYRIIYIGLFMLFLSYLVLSIDFPGRAFDSFSFWAGVPFFISAFVLLLVTIKNHKLTTV